MNGEMSTLVDSLISDMAAIGMEISVGVKTLHDVLESLTKSHTNVTVTVTVSGLYRKADGSERMIDVQVDQLGETWFAGVEQFASTAEGAPTVRRFRFDRLLDENVMIKLEPSDGN